MMKKLFILTVVLFEFSCNPVKKAQQSIDNIAVKYPSMIAEKAKTMFPCVPVKGDTSIQYISDSSAYQEVIELLQSQLYNTNQLLDSLLGAVQTGDTTCKKYEVAINTLRKQNADLTYKVQHIQPVHDTKIITLPPVEDTRKIFLCEADKTKLITLVSDKTAEADDWHGKAKKRGLIMWGLIVAVVLYIAWRVYSAFKPKVKA